METRLLQVIKLPQFYITDPLIWFMDVEDKFLVYIIGEEHLRYRLILRSLPIYIIQVIKNVFMELSNLQPYSDVKKAILDSRENTKIERLRKRAVEIQLGDKKPSEMLEALYDLTKGEDVEEEVLREIWLEKLPLDIRHSLASSERYLSLNYEADNADKILAEYIAKLNECRLVTMEDAEVAEIKMTRQLAKELNYSLKLIPFRGHLR